MSQTVRSPVPRGPQSRPSAAAASPTTVRSPTLLATSSNASLNSTTRQQEHRSVLLPTSVLHLLVGLHMIVGTVVTVMAIIVIIVPRMYEIVGSPQLSAGSGDGVVYLPDFTAQLGIALVCYDVNCISRDSRSTSPIPTSTLSRVRDNQLPLNVSNLVLGLTENGPLDFSVMRGMNVCGTPEENARGMRGLILALLCLAAITSLAALIPALAAFRHWIHAKHVSIALASSTAQHHEAVATLSNVAALQKGSKSERFAVAMVGLLDVICCGAMVAVVALYYHWEGAMLHCDGDDVCASIISGLRSYSINVWNAVYASSSPGQPVPLIQLPTFTCGGGSSMVCMWIALIGSIVMLVIVVVMMLVHWCSDRKSFLKSLHHRLQEVLHRLQREDRQQVNSSAAAAVAGAQTQQTPDSASRRVPTSQPRRGQELLSYSPRDSATPTDADDPIPIGGEQHPAPSLIESRIELLECDEHATRVHLTTDEHIEFYGNVSLAKRKLWRGERVVSLHQWTLDWYFGSLLDLHVEETFYRQELIRKWYAKLLDKCIGFPPVATIVERRDEEGDATQLLQPMAHRLVSFDAALHWASFYDDDDDDGDAEHAGETSTFMPSVTLYGVPHFAREWMNIIDSPTRRCYPSRSRGRDSSVEVSSATTSEDEGESSVQRRAVGGGGSVVSAAKGMTPLKALIDSRALYPTTISPRAIFPSDVRRSPPRIQYSGSVHPDHSGPSLDFKAITQANDAIRKAYEMAVIRSSSRLPFDRGLDPKKDAAKDYLTSIQRAQTSLEMNPPPPPLMFPSSSVSSSRGHQTTAIGAGVSPSKSSLGNSSAVAITAPQDWGVATNSSWGEGAVAERLAHLSMLSRSSTHDADDEPSLL